MTIGHLVECLLSKVATLEGTEGDATPFTTVTVEQVSEKLRDHGYQSRGCVSPSSYPYFTDVCKADGLDLVCFSLSADSR